MTKSRALTHKLIDDFQSKFLETPSNRIAMNAVTKTAIPDIALNREALISTDFTFSHVVETGEVTNQQASGRCWSFAGLNTLRTRAMKKMNLANFELSQSYNFFWDKLEKSNYFLESIIETREEHIHSRLIMWLLSAPLNDGGQWDMFANLIHKYGVVPKSIMPESFNSSNSGHINYFVSLKLKEHAMTLRGMHQKGSKVEALRETKLEMMAEIYKMLVIYFGEPPKKFDWQWRDKDKKFNRHEKSMTPVEFYKEYVDFDLNEMVSLLNCPTQDKPFNRMYTVNYLGNIVGGQAVKYLNVDIGVLKQITAKVVSEGEPVWFGCDVGKMLYRDGGIMHSNMYEYDKLLGTQFGLDKAQRVDYGDSLMTHAMVFTGVNLVGKKPTKWKVENSWGDKGGEKGFFVMNDAWFDEYLYQVVIPKKHLSDALQKELEQPPIELNPWDPMGSLAMMF